MKKITVPLAIASMLCFTNFTASLPQNTKENATVVRWFKFVGYDPLEPLDWMEISENEPMCHASSGNICTVFSPSYADGGTNYPTADALLTLYQSSGNFTWIYTGTYGKVRVTDH